MPTRKDIRDAVADRLRPAIAALNPELEVFTWQKAMVQTYAGLVSIYFDDGRAEHSLTDRDDLAELTIRIMLTDQPAVDDALDEIGNAIETAIESDPLFGGMLSVCTFAAWAYDRDISQGWTGLRLTYNTQYAA